MDLQRIAEEKLARMGYETPAASNNSGRALYHSERSAYDEKGVATHIDPYTQMAVSEKSRIEVCPTCQLRAMYVCECEYGEMMCKSGHYWYTTKTGKVIAADPHETESTVNNN